MLLLNSTYSNSVFCSLWTGRSYSLPPGEGRREGNTRNSSDRRCGLSSPLRSETSETPEADGEGHQGFLLWRNSGWKRGKEWHETAVAEAQGNAGCGGGGRMWRRTGGTKSSWEGDPGTSFGKGSGGKLSHVRAAASGPGLLTAQPTQCAPREPPRVPTLLFLNLTRNGLVRLSAL